MPSGLFFVPILLSILSLLNFFICFFVLFDPCCSHARVFGKTLVHEFPISYSHTEWYLLFSRGWRYPATEHICRVKNFRDDSKQILSVVYWLVL